MTRGKPLTFAQKVQIATKIRRGWSAAVVGRDYGIHPDTARKIANRKEYR